MRLLKPSHNLILPGNGVEILKFIEQAARVCYKSEAKISTESCHEFIAMLLHKGHFTPIEHVSFTAHIICDRGVSHELVRHRIASINQESTRYCKYKDDVQFVIPSWIDCIRPGIYTDISAIDDIAVDNPHACTWITAMFFAEAYYKKLLLHNWSAQQARSVLPNSLKTELYITANLREWRHILQLRCLNAAHPDMQALMRPILAEVQSKIPIIFDDIKYE